MITTPQDPPEQCLDSPELKEENPYSVTDAGLLESSNKSVLPARELMKRKQKSFTEFKLNLVREFGTQANPAEMHLQLAKIEKTSKESNIEYFYRMQEMASRINLEDEAEKLYIIKEDRAVEM
ncbi:hypothetical protein TNCT_183941 [Trichonephila clavata]|uniref:Retrotransposon gag domain-containing protein n=1 Tax=Trichonephila clavata TaxID=2740835 RepID=A0A8X6IVC0_TRICU|nr:hypothetical protein TNCT_183941 [Trichonephila clavata]